KYIVEVQVRTIFEEAWSEIDHDIRYPIHNNSSLVDALLMNFNRLAGFADEMGSYLKQLKFNIEESEKAQQLELEKKEKEISALKQEIQKLEIDAEDRSKITGLIDNIEYEPERYQNILKDTNFSLPLYNFSHSKIDIKDSKIHVERADDSKDD